jgi:DNA-binding FadR family transcriptional regulator
LRDQILDGSIPDGSSLPTQEDLHQTFNVSYPSIREALRILEAEGLVTVRRGLRGGAIVHRPSPESAAYMVGLVLQAERVALDDLAGALELLEPICAGLCAERADNARTARILREGIEESTTALDDGLEFTRIARKFHSELVHRSANRTLMVLVGIIESLWSMQEEAWAERAQREGVYPARALREQVLKLHRQIADAIESGDSANASRIARLHLKNAQPYLLDKGSRALVNVPSMQRAIRKTSPSDRVD